MKTKKNKTLRGTMIGVAFIAVAALIFSGCPSQQQNMMGSGDAAQKVYVAPGDHDEFYSFFSGGYSGQLSVWGLPSARMLKVIPVFSQDPETAYGYSEETKPLFNTSYGFIPWDDSHHPHISQTDGNADGRWIFINANNTPRIARIDLNTFQTKEILELPNTGGNHASSYVTSNTEYVIGATRFSIPYEKDLDVPIDSYSDEFRGSLSFIAVDQETGMMEVDFQIVVPPYNYDLGRAGKGISSDWVFFTTYNTEEAHTMLEVNASRNDKDFIAAVNWKKAAELVRDGHGKTMDAEYYHNHYNGKKQGYAVSEVKNEVTVLDTREIDESFIYYLPTPKSPHGVDVDPTGEYIVGGGKLATVIPVHSFSNMLEAIENEDIDDYIDGIPVLNYDATIAGEVENPGLGPLHTEFDGKGYAYTSVYISSEIVKWSLETFEVVDRIDSYYSIGHLMITGGDTRDPDAQYMVGLTKTAKDRYLPTGPKQNHPAQLYDISGDKMELLLDFPTIGEPHYAQSIRADKIVDQIAQIYEMEENDHPDAITRMNDNRVERRGNDVHIYMGATRSHFRPDNIEGVKLGDDVYVHLTNMEQEWDVVHGIAIKGAQNTELLVPPGQTKTIKWTPTRTGIFPFYCTAFCSALHQEMQGYIRVSAPDSNVELTWSTNE